MQPARPDPLPQPHRCPSNSVTNRWCVLVRVGVYLACRAPVGIGGNLVGEGGLDDIGLLLGVYRTVPEAHEGEQENKRTRERERTREHEETDLKRGGVHHEVSVLGSGF